MLELEAAKANLEALSKNQVGRVLDAQQRHMAKAMQVAKATLGSRVGARPDAEALEMERFVAMGLSGTDYVSAEARRKTGQLQLDRTRKQRRALWIFALQFKALRKLHPADSHEELTAERAWEYWGEMGQMVELDLAGVVAETVSAHTLGSYGQPQNSRSRKGQRRLAGRGTQAWKMINPPKNQGVEHLNVHHDRKHRELIRMWVAQLSEIDRMDVIYEGDDHAYMNFQKQAGLRGGRDGRQLVEENVQPGVRKGDYSDNRLHITPFTQVYMHPKNGDNGSSLPGVQTTDTS